MVISTQQHLPSLSGIILKTLIWLNFRLLIVLCIGLVLLPANYFWHSNSFVNNPAASLVHKDKTAVAIPKPQVAPQVILIVKNQDGNLIKVLAHQEQYSEFVNLQVAHLEKANLQIRQQVKTQFLEGLDLIFDQVLNNIPQFANWYYAYGTQYQLLWESLNSAFHHVGEAEIQEAILNDLEKIVQNHYEVEVLKPEWLDAKLTQLYQEVLNSASHSYLNVIANMEDDLQSFIAENTSYLSGSHSAIQELQMDWSANVRKLKIAPDAQFTLGGIRSISFAAVGGMMGSRLLLPFINRAMLTVAGGSVGVTTGPVGVILGATAGLAIDWLLLQGTELLTRPQFESEILATVNLTKEIIKIKLLSALLDTVDVQHQDLVQLIVKF